MIPLWQRLMLAGQWTHNSAAAANGALILRNVPGQMPAVDGKNQKPRSTTDAEYSREFNRQISPKAPSRRRDDTQSALNIEIRPLTSCRFFIAEWQDLQSRCLEDNAFAAPEIMLAAAQHLPSASPPAVLVIREHQKLLGIIPLETMRLPVLPGALHGYVTPYHPVGVPLIDRRHAAAVITKTLDWCALQSEPLSSVSGETLGLAGIVWRKLPLEGAFSTLLHQIAARSGRTLHVLDAYKRPILLSSRQLDCMNEVISTRHSQNLRRLMRRMHESGSLRFVEAITKSAINEALETLMVLEAASWKGERGTAMVQDARVSCFIRSTVRQMVMRGQANIITMFSAEKPVAAALIFEAKGAYFCFKIAYDPAYAKYSPGMILAHEVGLRLSAKPGFRYADSCVEQEHSFMSRVWPDTAQYGDIMIALQGWPTLAASAMRMRERLKRRLKTSAKSIYHQLRD